MQKSVRISSISADILNLFSILTHSHTPSVVGRDNTKKGQRENIGQKGDGVLLNFSSRWPHSFFIQLGCWISISRQFIVAQVKFPKAIIQDRNIYSCGLRQMRLMAPKTSLLAPLFLSLRQLQKRLPTANNKLKNDWRQNMPGYNFSVLSGKLIILRMCPPQCH